MHDNFVGTTRHKSIEMLAQFVNVDLSSAKFEVD